MIWVNNLTKPNLPGAVTLRLDPTTTCLLIIDMQKDFVSTDGAFAKFNKEYVKLARKAIPIIQKASDFCRNKGIPVFYTKQIHVPEAFSAGLHSIFGREMSALRNAGIRFCIRGTEGTEIIDELKPKEKDYIVEKNKPSAFYNTWLELWLRYLRIRTILVTGVNTGYCVAHTVMDAWARDLDTIVIEDGIGDPFPFVHENLLALFDMRWGRVLKWESVEKALKSFPNSVELPGESP